MLLKLLECFVVLSEGIGQLLQASCNDIGNLWFLNATQDITSTHVEDTMLAHGVVHGHEVMVPFRGMVLGTEWLSEH